LIRIRPPIISADWQVDLALICCLVAVTVQLIPLPPSVRAGLSPHLHEVERTLQIERLGVAPSFQALSLAPDVTALSLANLAMLIATFWLARHVFESGAARRVVRAIAWLGLVVSVAAILQLAVSTLLIYGFWRPDDASARPFGPFVNRNHMATWLVLCIPLTCGYLMAHMRARMHRRAGRDLAIVHAIDSTTIWQAGSGVMMISALFASVSRSGVIALITAATTGFVLARAKLGVVRMKWLVGAAVFALAIATYLANFDELAGRFAEALERGNDRTEIWRQTLPIVRDFALTGTGEGTFSRAMLVYQEGDRQLLFNHAHNQYLQIAAEGGLLVGVPALCAGLALVTVLFRRLRGDDTALFWIRAGATAGLVGVAVQSLWETGWPFTKKRGRMVKVRRRRACERIGEGGRPLSSQSSGRGTVSRADVGRARESNHDAD